MQNPVPDQTQAAFAPSPMNQYPANPAPFQAADPNMGMNAVAKNTIPDNTQVSKKWKSCHVIDIQTLLKPAFLSSSSISKGVEFSIPRILWL